MSIDDETLFSKDKREMEFLLRSLEYLAAMLECIGCDAINVLCLWWEKEESKNCGIKTSSWKEALSIGKEDDGYKYLYLY